MIRWLLVLAFLVLAVPAALAVSNPSEMLPDPAAELRAQQIGQQLRCMVCQNESVEASDADLARDFRRIIRSRITIGDSDSQILDWMTARYGDFIRLRPPFNAMTAVLWASPVLALGAGLVTVLLSRRRRPAPPAPLTDAERLRLEQFDAT